MFNPRASTPAEVLDISIEVKALVWSRDKTRYSTLILWPRAEPDRVSGEYPLVLDDHCDALEKVGMPPYATIEIWSEGRWLTVGWHEHLLMKEEGEQLLVRRKGIKDMLEVEAGARSVGLINLKAFLRKTIQDMEDMDAPDLHSSPLARKRPRQASPTDLRKRVRREEPIRFGTGEYPYVVDSDN